MERIRQASLRRHLTQDLKVVEKESYMDIWKRILQLERTSTEALKLDHIRCVHIIVQRPVWLDWREQGKATEVEAKLCRAFKADVRTLALSQ